MTVFHGDNLHRWNHDLYGHGPTGDPWLIGVMSWILLLVALPVLVVWGIAQWLVDRCRR